jgi:hypothetical protein
MYSTGCVAEDSWRRGGWCALVGNGETIPNKYYYKSFFVAFPQIL